MADNPLITNTVPYSINYFDGDGTTATREINFAGGYISRDHVKAFQQDLLGVATDVTLSFIGPFTVNVSPVTPVGYKLTIFRDTPKDKPEVDFVDGAIINEPNLDRLAEQSVFVAAEMVDRFGAVSDQAGEAFDLATQAVADALAAVTTSGEAQDAASAAVITAASASSVANDVAAQFDQLREDVSEIVGGDLADFAKKSDANAFTGANDFAVSPTVPSIATGPAGDLRAANTTYVKALNSSTISLLQTSTDVKVAAGVVEAKAAAATDATDKANAAQAAAIASSNATAAAAYLPKAAPVITGGANVTGVMTHDGGYNGTTVALAGAVNMDVALANSFTASRATAGSFTFSNVPSGRSVEVLLKLTLTATSAITFPGSVKWYTPIPQWLTGKYAIIFITVDGGTSWMAFGAVESV